MSEELTDQEIEKALDRQKKKAVIQGKTVWLRMPNPGDTTAADERYADVLNRHLEKGTPTKREQLGRLFKRKLFHPGKTYDTREQDELSEPLLEKRKLLWGMENKPDGLVKELGELEARFRQVNAEIAKFTVHTCEGFAETAQHICLLVRCTSWDEEGKEPIWKTLEEYESSQDNIFALAIFNRAMRFWMGIDELPLEGIFSGGVFSDIESLKSSDTPSGESP